MVILLVTGVWWLALAPQANAVTLSSAQLVRTINAFSWNPAAPDTSGITYIPAKNQLLVADSEVDEMPIFKGANLFYTTLDGNLVSTGNTTIWNQNRSFEPTGVSFDSSSGLAYISDDDQKRVNIVNPGTDAQFGTADDKVTFFSTLSFGSTDPESVAVSPDALYIGSGIDHTVFKVTKNGTKILSFDTAAYNLMDLEGITYNFDTNTVFVLSANPRMIGEFTTAGSILRLIDISAANPRAPADIVFAPTSNTTDNPSAKSMYMVARGVDNNADPTELDGKIYEMSVADKSVLKTGDVNNDGRVDIIDIGIVIDNYSKLPIPNPLCDLNKDGTINIVDIGILLDNYGL